MVTVDTGTAPRRNGGRRAAPQPVPKPRRRQTVRRNSAAQSVEQVERHETARRWLQRQRHRGRGTVADHDDGNHGDHVRERADRQAGRASPWQQRVGHCRHQHGSGGVRGVLNSVQRDHRYRLFLVDTQHPHIRRSLLPKRQDEAGDKDFTATTEHKQFRQYRQVPPPPVVGQRHTRHRERSVDYNLRGRHAAAQSVAQPPPQLADASAPGEADDGRQRASQHERDAAAQHDDHVSQQHRQEVAAERLDDGAQSGAYKDASAAVEE